MTDQLDIYGISDDIHHLIERFTTRYGSFKSQEYLTDERNYKVEGAQHMRERLSRDVLQELITRGQYEEAKTQIKRAYQGNNLLNQWDVQPILDAPAELLARRLYDLLYATGRVSFEQRFDAWVDVLALKSPRCWPAATFFLMLHDPEQHLFVKATPYRALLSSLESPIQWDAHPNAASYRQFQNLGIRLLEHLRVLGARDMIDVQSFIWIVQAETTMLNENDDEEKEPRVMPKPKVTSRISRPELLPFYAATKRFVEEGLQSEASLFTPGVAIWTRANIDDLYERIVVRLDLSNRDFMTKLRDQLAGASSQIVQLAAELLYVHLIVTNGMKAITKHRQVEKVLSWLPTPIKIPGELTQAFEAGVANAGVAFLVFKPYQLGFLVEFVRRWKGQSHDERDRMLLDPWKFKAFLFDIPIQRAFAQREALLHLVHPDTFEPIVSRDHKQRFAQQYASLVTQPTTDIDQKLRQIREHLASQYGQDFSFYLRGNVVPPLPSSLPRSLGDKLRPYIELVIHLNDASYTAEEIVNVLRQMKSTDLTTVPDADELASDLMLLRLLEPLEEGRFRRWQDLADAEVEHLVRYAALTLLIPNSDEDNAYLYPVAEAPFDAVSHPTSAWPVGEDLLHWYEEAKLVERLDGGQWQGLPGALEPVQAGTTTAQAINTFLQHLHRYKNEQAQLPAIENSALPQIPSDALEQRIAEIQMELLIDRITIQRIYRSLVAGHHVILSGPPGTGKTHLARLLPRILWRDETLVLELPTNPALPPTEPPLQQRLHRHGYAAEVVTTTEDWSVRHVVGGIVPQLRRNGEAVSLVYGVRHGHMTRVMLQNYAGYDGERVPSLDSLRRQEYTNAEGQHHRGIWLVIDEFTRAPIDAAFGSLLTTLGGQRQPALPVPNDDGDEQMVPLPRDFRLIGTLNSFDRHFLNQISEAMKRRFTFIDILPPAREYAESEQGLAIYHALGKLQEQGLGEAIAGDSQGVAQGYGVKVQRERGASTNGLAVTYAVETGDAASRTALDSFWRIFSAIRVYRQLGTAQAESVYAAMFAGRSIGMEWAEALDSALADVLADQLQVLGRDEVRVLMAYIEHAGDSNPEVFVDATKAILNQLPGPRQVAHLARFKSAYPARPDPIHASNPSTLTFGQLERLFPPGERLIVPPGGMFTRRLEAFVNEYGL